MFKGVDSAIITSSGQVRSGDQDYSCSMLLYHVIRSASQPAFPFHFGTTLHSHDRLAHVLFGSLEIRLQIL